MKKIYRCQHCNYTETVNKNETGIKSAKYKMGQHYENRHKDMLPPDMDGWRWFYFLLTKKDHGSCVECKKETEFNRVSMKYSRFCNNPLCKQKYKEERDRRMIGKYGKVYLLDDPEFQKKMQEGRKIAGVYTWSDRSIQIGYLSSYELHFLQFLDIDLHWPSSDIMQSPHVYTYMYKEVKHFYMPDFFIPSLNLEIEIKSSERMRNQNQESREKEIEKNKLMESCSNLFNYIMILDKDYTKFVQLIKEDK